MERTEIERIVRQVLETVENREGIPANVSNSQVSGTTQPVQVALPLEKAVKLIERVEQKASQMGLAVVTAVSDAAGRPIAVHCMDGAYIGSFDIAVNKTYTSIAFKMSTEELGKLSQPGESLYGIQFTNGGKLVIFGGGELLKKNGVIFGAIGVSGGSAAQDLELAQYGKNIFEEV